MTRFIIVCILCGIIFGFLDGAIHANPKAKKLFEVYKPIAKTSINIPAGIIIDLIYGFVMGAIFLVLFNALPGSSGLIKGVSFGLIIWFFRVLMGVLSSWMMYNIPLRTLLYIALTGLVEMLIIGILYGLFLRPFNL